MLLKRNVSACDAAIGSALHDGAPSEGRAVRHQARDQSLIENNNAATHFFPPARGPACVPLSPIIRATRRVTQPNGPICSSSPLFF